MRVSMILRKFRIFEILPGNFLESEETPQPIKDAIIRQKRRIIVFKYPSDEHQVKGYISFTPEHEKAPLLVFLRGGNRILGLMNPATDFTTARNYTILATAYRGGVSEGQDEFGGEEVNDVENLVKFLPVLEEKLGVKLSPEKKFILGGSRGGMEMFLALQRSVYLQSYFDKAVSLSGPMDLRTTIKTREAMRTMFVDDFGLKPGVNEEERLSFRSPIDHTDRFNKELPILIIQGKQDHRTHLGHGKRMFEKLKGSGHRVEYWEIEDGQHCLNNIPNRMELISDWLAK